jgi:hypothetical protein
VVSTLGAQWYAYTVTYETVVGGRQVSVAHMEDEFDEALPTYRRMVEEGSVVYLRIVRGWFTDVTDDYPWDMP